LADNLRRVDKIEVDIFKTSGPLRRAFSFDPRIRKEEPKMTLAPSKVRPCAQILPTGSQCRQFALRNRPWCQTHADETQRVRAAHANNLVAKIPGMDMFELAVTLLDTTFEVQHKYLPPLHAYAIFQAAISRIELAEEAWVVREQARLMSAQTTHANRCTSNLN
jgi:hypothetical protein